MAKRETYLIGAALVLALRSFAAPVPGAASKSVDLKAVSSTVGFIAIGSPSALKIYGKVDEKSALEGSFERNGEAVSGTAKFPLDRFDTGIELRNRHMKEKYLETAKFPHAELELTKLSLPTAIDGEKELPFEGKLRLHGVEKPVKGIVLAKRSGTGASLQFKFPVKLEEHGIGVPSFMGITVASEVNVDVALTDVAL